MKVSPSEGENPISVVIKLNAQWAQVPPVSSGFVAYLHGCKITNQKLQHSMLNHRKKIPPNMLTKRHVSQIQLIANITKLWASDPHLTSGLRSQNKSKKGRTIQRQITYNKGIPRVNNHVALKRKTNRNTSPTLTIAYNIPGGDKKSYLVLIDIQIHAKN
jgi:hypothetical protein